MSMPQAQASGGAYGAGKAGAPFDPLEFIKKPQVILRAVSLVRIFMHCSFYDILNTHVNTTSFYTGKVNQSSVFYSQNIARHWYKHTGS